MLPPCSNRRLFKEAADPNIFCHKKELIERVILEDGRILALGFEVTSKEGKKGVIIELDNAQVLNDFIRVWWSDEGNKYGTWCTLDKIASVEIKL